MDIQEAISELKMENALLGVRNPMKVARNDLAISALQEQAEREKGCEYCDGYGEKYGPYFKTEFFKQTAADEAYDIDIETLFCPHCGKRLK